MNDSKLLFIADLHLSESNTQTCARFFQFLQEEASKASALYILGDLFEYWIGDEMLNRPIFNQIAKALYELKNKNVKTYFIYGNRDFLIGKTFLSASGLTLLKEPFLLHYRQLSLMLMHGDSLCTRDWPYQIYKKFARQPIIQHLFLMLPLVFRQKLADRIRTKSQRRQIAIQHKQCFTTDANEKTVEKTFRRFAVNNIIHGHTHRPAHHQTNGNNRYVLSDWVFDKDKRRGNYLLVDNSGIKSVDLK